MFDDDLDTDLVGHDGELVVVEQGEVNSLLDLRAHATRTEISQSSVMFT